MNEPCVNCQIYLFTMLVKLFHSKDFLCQICFIDFCVSFVNDEINHNSSLYLQTVEKICSHWCNRYYFRLESVKRMKTAHLRVQLVLPLIITFRDISILLQIRCLHLKAAVDCICQTRLHWTVAKDKWMEIWILVDSESDEFPSLEFECLFFVGFEASLWKRHSFMLSNEYSEWRCRHT